MDIKNKWSWSYLKGHDPVDGKLRMCPTEFQDISNGLLGKCLSLFLCQPKFLHVTPAVFISSSMASTRRAWPDSLFKYRTQARQWKEKVVSIMQLRKDDRFYDFWALGDMFSLFSVFTTLLKLKSQEQLEKETPSSVTRNVSSRYILQIRRGTLVAGLCREHIGISSLCTVLCGVLLNLGSCNDKSAVVEGSVLMSLRNCRKKNWDFFLSLLKTLMTLQLRSLTCWLQLWFLVFRGSISCK